MNNIVLTGGGTLGHSIPHLAIYKYIKNDFDNFYYIGSYDGLERGLMSEHFEYYPITTTKFNRKLTFDNFMILPKLIKGVNECEKLLKKLQPSVVFSKGGYVSLPVCLASKMLNIPVVSHESDLTMGLATKINARFSKYVLTSFYDTAKSCKNGIFTGPPVREFRLNKLDGLRFFRLKGEKPILLVLGGSLGSQKINKVVMESLQQLLKGFEVLHIVGKGNLTNTNITGYREVEFVADIAKAYSVASIAISRCGSNSAFELLSLSIPTLFIPLSKKVSRGDQIDNAKYFKSKDCCNVLYEENLTSQKLVEEVTKTFIMGDRFKSNLKREKFSSGNERIAYIIKNSKKN